METVVAEVDAVAQIVHNDLRSVIQIEEREFNHLIKEPAPWLVKMGEDQPILRVRPENVGTAELHQRATPDEIRVGRFYKDEAEYRADRAA